MQRQRIGFTKWWFVLTGLAFIFSCATTKKAVPLPSPSPQPAVTQELDESFDPLSLQDEDITFPRASVAPPQKSPAGGGSPEKPEQPLALNRQISGYRVQLLATKDIEKAALAKKEAEFQFAGDSVGVYLEFDSPYYKLRIGDCQTREQAEKLRDLARQRGYSKAWIVRTKIWLHPVLSQQSTEEPQP